MTKIKLKSKIRDIVGKKVKKFRKSGLVPAVVYGRNISPRNLWVNLIDLKKVYNEAGESALIEVDIEGKSVNALIHEIQTDSLSGNLSHVDFFEVNMSDKIETEVPLDFIGESDAVKSLGGFLLKNIDEVSVSCLPNDLPAKIVVDISVLRTFDDQIKIKQLEVSDKVKIISDEDVMVASVIPPRSEEEISELDKKVEEDVTKVQEAVKKEVSDTKEEK